MSIEELFSAKEQMGYEAAIMSSKQIRVDFEYIRNLQEQIAPLERQYNSPRSQRTQLIEERNERISLVLLELKKWNAAGVSMNVPEPPRIWQENIKLQISCILDFLHVERKAVEDGLYKTA